MTKNNMSHPIQELETNTEFSSLDIKDYTKMTHEYSDDIPKNMLMFFQERIKKNRLPTMEGFLALHLIPVHLFEKWLSLYDELIDAYKICYCAQLDWVQENSINGNLNPMISLYGMRQAQSKVIELINKESIDVSKENILDQIVDELHTMNVKVM